MNGISAFIVEHLYVTFCDHSCIGFQE